jgi:hypothetical protein
MAARVRKCIRCKKRKQHSREVCQVCNRFVQDGKAAGDFTDQEAVERGLIGPAAKPGRPRVKRRKLAKV